MLVDKTSLILEGGTFRTVYSAGVLDAFLEEGIMLPYIVGISAGAITAVSYMSQQKGRTIDVFRTFRNDPRYMGIRNLWREKSYFGLQFSYETIPNELKIFDWETYFNYKGLAEFGVTNAISGQIEFMDAMKMNKSCDILRATCAIPFVFPEILLNGTPYYDGGLADPIPLSRAKVRGFERHIIVLTRPAGYRKTLGKGSKIAIRILRKKFPHLVETMKRRADVYNQSLQRCLQLEKEGRAFIFRPPHALKSFEGKTEKIEHSYSLGYEEAKQRMLELKKFLGIV